MGVGLFGANVRLTAAQQSFALIEKQAKYAQAAALTAVAKLAQAQAIADTGRVFDRPTPFTLGSTYVRPATPNRLIGEIGFRGATEAKPHYLSAEVLGGSRTVKRFETLLRRYGVLGADEYVVPASGFPLDPYGNVPRNVYAGILADLQAHPDAFSRSTPESRDVRSNRKLIAKRAIYFATRPGSRLPLGIYQRVKTASGSAIRGVFMFIREPRYKVRLPLLEIVTQVYNQNMAAEYSRQLANAFATAR